MRQRLGDELEALVQEHVGGFAPAKSSSAFGDWRVFVGQPVTTGKVSSVSETAQPAGSADAESIALRAALDFFAANGIKVARRGDQRHRPDPSIRINGDQLQQATARLARIRASSDAVRGTFIKLGVGMWLAVLAAVMPTGSWFGVG